MATNKVLDATSKLVAILEPLENVDRQKVIQAAFVLLGVTPSDAITVVTPAGAAGSAKPGLAGRSATNEKAFFDLKQPTNKGEELAVAARFREESLGAAESTKEELKAVFSAARRNFDSKNYGRDLNNARTKGLFNRGGERSKVVLSHYGQNYVDALPDQEAVKAIRKPKGAGAKKTAKRTAKKTTKGIK